MSERMKAIEEMDTETLIQATLARIRERQGEAHRDAKRWQSRAESAEARVEELTTENARLEQEATADDLRISRLTKERDGADEALGKSETRVLELRQERDEHRAEVERLRSTNWRVCTERNDARVELDRLRTAVPRVIRPGEVREGQTVAIIDTRFGTRETKSGVVGLISTTINGSPVIRLESRWLGHSPQAFHPITEHVTIHLLVDAPEDADEERTTCGCDCGCGATP